MAVSEDDVRQVFRGLENGNRAKFFDHVADYVDWIVEGAHSLAAHYRSKDDLLAGSFANRILPLDARLIVEHVMVKDDQAVVALVRYRKGRRPVRHSLLLGCPLCRRNHRSSSSLSGLCNGRASF